MIALLADMVVAMALNPSGTLPILHIQTENHIPVSDKENFVKASYWLDEAGTDTEPLGSEDSPLSLEIRGRGNYTWLGFDKKPYKLKFSKKTPILGMDENKHFALLAHADDELAFLRNAIGFKLSEMLDLPWTPSGKPIEVILNDEYIGLYFLTETIRVDKKRVNIFEMEDNVTDDVTGGWLVEIDNYDNDPHISITEGNGHKIVFTYKTPENLSLEQKEYLRKEMSGLNIRIYGDKDADALWAMLDLEKAAKFYIIQEILDDCESYHGSCYLYKERGETSRWCFGPVWDFGNAFRRGNKNKFIFTEPSFNQTWIGEIYKFPAFQEKVKEIWKDFCINHCKELQGFVQTFINEIEPASKCNYERWPQYENGNVRGKMQEVLEHLSRSLEWLGTQWGYKAPDISLPPLVYVRGGFNGWSTDNPMTLQSNGTWTLNDFHLDSETELKIASKDWVIVDYGAPHTDMELIPDQEFPLAKVGHNIRMGTCEAMTLIFNPDKETLLLTPTSGNPDKPYRFDGNEIQEIYTLSGIRVSEMNVPGVYIVRKGENTHKYLKR